jgi:hypothetical protein
MTAPTPSDDIVGRLQESCAALRPGNFEATKRLLADPLWDRLEAHFWNASHPLPAPAKEMLDAYLTIAKSLWHNAGLGQAHPIALYKTTLLSSAAIETALRVLARIYAGCNLGFCSPPPGFWRTVYALTGYIISERFTDRAHKDSLTNQTLQLWLMAWLNPLSLAPGRLPVAVRLVGILSKTCSYTLSSPTHAGSGLAAADLLSDIPPMPFARIPVIWEPIAPLYVNAQDAAFTIRGLATPPTKSSPSDLYESLLQSAMQVGLTTQEMQDFVRRAVREFGYTNGRIIPRVGRMERVSTVIGFIECWSAVQGQSKPVSQSNAFSTHQALVVNHSDGGVLLRFDLTDSLLSVGSLICLRGSDAEPWTIASVRWLEDTNGTVMVGCEVLCNFGAARIAQNIETGQQIPTLTYGKDDSLWILGPYDTARSQTVSQLRVDNEYWVLAVASELGEDWQRGAVLDVTAGPTT